MQVSLGNYTHNPIIEIYRAYKLCYAKGTQYEIKIPMVETEIGDKPDVKKMMEFIKPLMAEGHTSPLEHVSFTFYIRGISRICSHQLVRHRTGKYNQQSQRYVDGSNFDFVVPETIKRAGLEYNFNNIMGVLMGAYEGFVKQGIPKEDARFLLPNATTTNITMTIDAHNFRNFLAQRTCKYAQWEIRELANKMLNLVEPLVPFIDYKAKWCGVICHRCEGEKINE